MQIRIAEKEDYIKVREFYYSLTDAMQEAEFRPGWEKNIYPSQDFLKESIENGELFLCEIENAVAACMVINHKCNEGYQKIRWSAAVSDSQLYVIHALGVHPDFSGRGIAKEMVRRAIRKAQIHEIRTIRLDVLEGNLPRKKYILRWDFIIWTRSVCTMKIPAGRILSFSNTCSHLRLQHKSLQFSWLNCNHKSFCSL